MHNILDLVDRSGLYLYADKGYVGGEGERLLVPIKKPKNKELPTATQKPTGPTPPPVHRANAASRPSRTGTSSTDTAATPAALAPSRRPSSSSPTKVFRNYFEKAH